MESLNEQLVNLNFKLNEKDCALSKSNPDNAIFFPESLSLIENNSLSISNENTFFLNQLKAQTDQI